jgi:hypothetical protein
MAQDIDRTNEARQIPVSRSSWMVRMDEEYLYDDESGQWVRFLGPFKEPDLSGSNNGEIEIVVESPYDRLEKYAAKYYGDPLLWPVIALRNGIDLPDNELYPGRRILIPAPDFVRRRMAV